MRCKITQHELLITDDPDYHSGPVHVSALIKRVAVATGVIDGKELDVDECQAMIVGGLSWEDYWNKWMAEHYESFEPHPFKLEVDNVIGRPDGATNEDVFKIEECKFTKKSCRLDGVNVATDQKWMMWRRQIQAYCYMVDTPYARLWAYHINGTYEKFNFGTPMFMAYDFEFTTQELERNWKVLLAQKVEGE